MCEVVNKLPPVYLRVMRPVLLVVMDGVGLRNSSEGNAFKQADTPNLDKLMEENGYQELEASGPAVGLPEGFTGNSEVGHLHLGAGRTVPQRLTRINSAVEKNKLRQKEALKQSLERAEENSNAVHLAGIVSDGGIHGHINHLKHLLKICSEKDIENVYIHCFTDGRDVPPKSGEKYISRIEDWTENYTGEIATVMGRFYSMDRDENWERTEKAYKAMTAEKGLEFEDPRETLNKTYEEGDYDYFTVPGYKKGFEGVQNQDELIFYNFRADRERQIAEALIKEEFEHFDNPVQPNFVSMLPYRRDFKNPVIFEKQVVENTLGEKIDEKNLSQLRVAESQKKPHVTYFFNGQRELEFENETRKFIESDKIKAFDQRPEMHAEEITDIVLNSLENQEHDFILLNYANCDLVGHTGDLEATIKAVETVDRNIGRLVRKVEEENVKAFITADHGNCEEMGTEENPKTSHTLNKVPMITVNGEEIDAEKLTDVKDVIESKLGIA